MGSRASSDPTKRPVRACRVDFDMPADLWQAFSAYREQHHSKPSHAARTLLADALVATGHLKPLKRAEDATELEDAFGFPWPSQGPKPSKLVWFSSDPSRLTWATLFWAMENETDTEIGTVAKRHGVSRVHAYRIFQRFDKWRRGQDHRPRLDPFAGRPRRKHVKRKYTRRKKDDGNNG